MIVWTIAILVSLVAIISLFATVLGLPGIWVIVVTALVLWVSTSGESFIHVSTYGVIALVVIALLGELVEFAASAAGVGKMGGSKRSAWLAVAGSIAGAIFGLFAGSLIPIPVIGSLVTSVLLGGIGAAIGAVIGERWVGKDWDQSARIGVAAMIGRLLGTIGKGICAAIMTVVLIWQVWF